MKIVPLRKLDIIMIKLKTRIKVSNDISILKKRVNIHDILLVMKLLYNSKLSDVRLYVCPKVCLYLYFSVSKNTKLMVIMYS